MDNRVDESKLAGNYRADTPSHSMPTGTRAERYAALYKLMSEWAAEDPEFDNRVLAAMDHPPAPAMPECVRVLVDYIQRRPIEGVNSVVPAWDRLEVLAAAVEAHYAKEVR